MKLDVNLTPFLIDKNIHQNNIDDEKNVVKLLKKAIFKTPEDFDIFALETKLIFKNKW